MIATFDRKLSPLVADDAIDLTNLEASRVRQIVVRFRILVPSLRLGVAMSYRDEVIIQRSW